MRATRTLRTRCRRDAPSAIAIVAAVVTACGSSQHSDVLPPTQRSISGRFDLVAYDAKPLPDTLRVIVGTPSTPGSTGTVSCPEILLGATLDIGPRDDVAPTFTRTSRIAYPCTGTLPRPAGLPDSTTWVETGHFMDNGLTITMSFDSFADTTSLEVTEVGEATGSDIVIGHVLLAPTRSSEDLPNARVYRHE